MVELNELLFRWLQDEVGTIDHGTTQEPPLIRFERDERKALKPLPAAAVLEQGWPAGLPEEVNQKRSEHGRRKEQRQGEPGQ